MKIVFLDAGTLYGHPNLEKCLSPFGDLTLHADTSIFDVVPRLREAEIVLTNKVVLDESTFSQCPNLKLVCVTATGTNNVDLLAAKKHGILVKNASNYSTNSVAQTTLAMVLHLLMRLPSQREFVQKQYTKHLFFTHLAPGFSELANKTWGIIGLGNIGKKVAQIAEAFGAKIVYHSPSGHVQETSFPCLSLMQLLQVSDVISIHTPLNSFTSNLIGKDELRECKQSAVLVNVARGGIVDEEALATALDNNELYGAAVDVYASEPIQLTNPLLHVKNSDKLLLTPHLAWGSLEARERLVEIVCQHICEFKKSK